MSRTDDRQIRIAASFPRVSGDEPAMADGVDKTKLFSPRERG